MVLITIPRDNFHCMRTENVGFMLARENCSFVLNFILSPSCFSSHRLRHHAQTKGVKNVNGCYASTSNIQTIRVCSGRTPCIFLIEYNAFEVTHLDCSLVVARCYCINSTLNFTLKLDFCLLTILQLFFFCFLFSVSAALAAHTTTTQKQMIPRKFFNFEFFAFNSNFYSGNSALI